MNYKILIILIIGSFLQCLYDIFIVNRISEREAKKSKISLWKMQKLEMLLFLLQEEKRELINSLWFYFLVHLICSSFEQGF